MKERYLRSVRTLLDCPSNEKERLLHRLDSAVATYLEDVPDAGESDLISVFGTPEDCAARLLEECTPGVITAERRKRNHRRHVLIAVLAVLLVIVTGITAYLCFNGGVTIIQVSRLPGLQDLPPGYVSYGYKDFGYKD